MEMITDETLRVLIPMALPDEDKAVLIAWLSQAGDQATTDALRGRVRAILAIQAAHPAHPPLSVLLEHPWTRAVLLAKPGNRTGVRKWLRRKLTHP